VFTARYALGHIKQTRLIFNELITYIDVVKKIGRYEELAS